MMVVSFSFPGVFGDNNKKYPFIQKLERVLRWVLIASVIWLFEKFFFQTFAVSILIDLGI